RWVLHLSRPEGERSLRNAPRDPIRLCIVLLHTPDRLRQGHLVPDHPDGRREGPCPEPLEAAVHRSGDPNRIWAIRESAPDREEGALQPRLPLARPGRGGDGVTAERQGPGGANRGPRRWPRRCLLSERLLAGRPPRTKVQGLGRGFPRAPSGPGIGPGLVG